MLMAALQQCLSFGKSDFPSTFQWEGCRHWAGDLPQQRLHHCPSAIIASRLAPLGSPRRSYAMLDLRPRRGPRLAVPVWGPSEAAGALLASRARGDLPLAGLDSSGSWDS